MKKLTILAAALAAAALAGSASAKEIQSLTVCGPNACVDIATGRDAHVYIEGTDGVAAPAVSEYYTLSATVRGDGETFSWTSYYVPSVNVLGGIGDPSETVHWTRMSERARAAYAKATAKLEPFPAPTITSAYVDGQRVTGDASTYARLLTLPEKFVPYPSNWDWIAVDLRSPHPSPWTASDRDLVYSPSANLLERGSVRIPVPDSLAADLEAARALGASPSSVWQTVLVAVAASVAAAALLVLAARRGPTRVAPARARLESP